METIKIEQKEKWWIATYKTLDIVAQGYTEYEAIRNLLDCIAIHIDYAIDNDNLANLKASQQDVEADAGELCRYCGAGELSPCSPGCPNTDKYDRTA